MFDRLEKTCKVNRKRTIYLSYATSKSLQVYRQAEETHESEFQKKNDAVMKCGELESKIRSTDFEIAEYEAKIVELKASREQTEDELLKNREITMSEGVAHAHVACSSQNRISRLPKMKRPKPRESRPFWTKKWRSFLRLGVFSLLVMCLSFWTFPSPLMLW